MTKLLFAMLFIADIAFAAKIYVVNSLDESLGWADSETGESQAQAVSLGNLANHLVVSGNRIYVVNSGLGTLQSIDRLNLQTIDEFAVTGAVNPYSAAVIDEQRVGVTGLLSGTVSVLFMDSGIIDTVLHTGIGPQAIYRFGDLIYVLNTGVEFPIFNHGSLMRYNSTTYELIDSVSVGINPQDVLVIGDEIHILCTGNYLDVFGTVEVRDIETLTLDTVLHVGGTPGAFSSDGVTVYIAAGGWVGAGSVYRYDVQSKLVLNDESNPVSCGIGATDIIALPSGGFAVSCFASATLELRSSVGDLQHEFLMSAGTGAIDIFSEQNSTDPRAAIPFSSNLITAFPNPFNSAITFEISNSYSFAGVDIFDVCGRIIASLPVGNGQTRIQWNPSKIKGREVASGCYFARPKSDFPSHTVRFIYLK